MSLAFKDANGRAYPKWEERRLGEVAQVKMGQSPNSEFYNFDKIGFPLVQGNADISERKTTPKRFTSVATKLADEGDIILSVRAPVGTVAKATMQVCIGRGVCAIKNSKNSNSLFLYQFLLNIENTWQSLAQGSTFTAISHKDIENLKFKLPTLPEQCKIADFFSAVDEKIALAKSALETAKALKKASLQRIFSGELFFTDAGKPYPKWEEKRLGDVASVVTDYVANGSFASLRENTKINDSEDYAYYVRLYDLKRGLNNKSQRFADKKTYDFLSKSALHGDEILIGNIGSVGECYLMPKTDKPATLAPNMILINFDQSKHNNHFIYNFLSSQVGQKKLKALVEGGGQPKINKTQLKTLKLQIPTLPEQRKIADFFSEIDKKISLKEKKLSTLNSLKKAFLQQIFSP